MASKLSGIELTRYDDLFKTDAEREADRQERIQIVPAAEVFPYSRQLLCSLLAYNMYSNSRYFSRQ